MGEVMKIVLIVFATIVSIIFTFDMVFFCWFRRKKEYWNSVVTSLGKGFEAISDQLKSNSNSQTKQS